MSSFGGFREGEINGKPFHIYTCLSQTDHIPTSSSSGEAAIGSGVDDLSPPQPLFICPSLRLKAQELKRKENGYSPEDFLPIDISPHFSSIRGADQKVQHLLDSDIHNICKLPLVPLFWCNNEEPNYQEFRCCACLSSMLSTEYYFCTTCHGTFHKECVESPLKIKRPPYSFLSLRQSTLFQNSLSCIYCETGFYGLAYHCDTHKISMHPVCAMKPIPIVINHPKRHPHLLTYFPKQASLVCDICGLIKELIHTYVCVRCVFVVHQDCIYFPYVIRISRHHHRISFASSLPSGNWSCGVCRKNIDSECGAYACNKCEGYFVHSRCALRKDLWDGKELEGVPEEPEIVVEPFERISDGVILHFTHGHNLKLEFSRVYDEGKFCQACVLPIYKGMYYSCMNQCDFILHETCAYAPRMKHHPLHRHPLTLRVAAVAYEAKGCFTCYACGRFSCGFTYACSKEECFDQVLDVRCGSVSEPFEYQGHKHPLFLSLDPKDEVLEICQVCQEGRDYSRKLSCIECDYIICFKCATLPYKARYKHDKHFLTFYEEKEASDHSEWCDVCERKLADSTRKGFYSCDDCCTTLHIDCLLGKDPYMKPGQTVVIAGDTHILRNSTLSRPFCHNDKERCPHKLLFKKKNMTFCSLLCSIQYGVD